VSETVLITGSDGYLGSRLVSSYLTQTNDKVIAWVRAKDSEEYNKKKKTLLSLLNLTEEPENLCFAKGDLREETPFSGVDPTQVTRIIHSASITRFNVEEKLARDVNYQGSKKVFEFAKRCKSLRRIAYLSTVYASGKRAGEIPEELLDDSAGFANFYESSKWQSETILSEDFGDLPWIIPRIATVICDDESGKVSQYNAVHNTLKLIYYGLLSLVPGNSTCPVYLVTGDFITKGVMNLMKEGVPLKRVYHLVHEKKDTIAFGVIIDTVYETFLEDPGFSQRKVLKPLLADEKTFALLAGQMDKLGGGVVQQALQSIDPFAKQLFIEKKFIISQTREYLSNYKAPDPRRLIVNTATALVRTKWGRK